MVSNYVAESLLQTYQNQHKFNVTLTSQALKDSAGLSFDTTSLSSSFPNIVKQYGADVPIDLQVELIQLQNFQVDKDRKDMKLEADVSVSLSLEHQKNKTKVSFLEFTLTNNVISFIIKQDEQDLYLACTGITYGQETIIKSELKTPLNSTSFTKTMTSLIPVAVQDLNEMGEKHSFKLPSTLFELYKIHDLNITNFDDYILFGFNTTFWKPDEDIPSILYQVWVPTEKITGYKDELYEEYLDSKGVYTSNTIRNYNFYEIFSNQINIFKSIPYILVK